MQKWQKKRFTLVELLVVIAIIAIFFGLTLPSFKKANMLAQRINCANNIRSTSIALLSYLDDNNGNMSVWCQSPYDNNIRKKLYWNYNLLVQRYINETMTNESGFEYSTSSMRCPYWKTGDTNDSRLERSTFGMNMITELENPIYVAGSHIPNPVSSSIHPLFNFNLTRIRNTSNYFLLGDSNATVSGGLQAYRINNDGKSGLFGRFHLRHLNTTANVSFVDGHVEAMSRTDISDRLNLREVFVTTKFPLQLLK